MPHETVFSAARKLRERPANVAKAVNKATTPSKSKKPAKARKSPTVSAADAIKNERVGRDGERSFGAPIDRQSTDSNN